MLQRLARGDSTKLVAGEVAVWSWLERRLSAAAEAGRAAYILFGTFHDAGAQLLAFRRALASHGLRGLSAITVEQLDADGMWEGVPLRRQRGDDGLLDGFLKSGDRGALESLRLRQHQGDYTAWKFGYVDEVMDLLLVARALRLPLAGCDMPRPLQERLALGSPLRERLRELHCLLALEQRLQRLGGQTRRPPRVAMVWGQDHVKPHGLPRFLPAGALVLSIYLLGGRPGPFTPEAELARRLTVHDLVLVPLDGPAEQLALLLPVAPLAGEVGRSREWLPAGSAGGTAKLRVSSRLPGELLVAGRRFEVGPRERERELPATASAAYLLRAGQRLVAGALELTAGSAIEVSFDPARRVTSLQVAAPHPSP